MITLQLTWDHRRARCDVDAKTKADLQRIQDIDGYVPAVTSWMLAWEGEGIEHGKVGAVRMARSLTAVLSARFPDEQWEVEAYYFEAVAHYEARRA